MGIIQSVVVLCGVFGIIIIGVLFILVCHHFPGWTWTFNYLFGSSKEEKMVLTKPDNYNTNGCMIPSSDSSEFALSFEFGRGSFRRFDKTDQDYDKTITLLRQSSSSSLTRGSTSASSIIPPQPLRLAPIPPYIVGGGPLQLESQSPVDSSVGSSSNAPSSLPLTHSVISITMPHSNGNASATSAGGGGSGNGSSSTFSNNNPFLPLIQASTQFFTQKFQSFQQQSTISSQNPGTNGTSNNSKVGGGGSCKGGTQRQSNESLHSVVNIHRGGVNESTVPCSVRNTRVGLSMGEILFSSPPAHSLPDEIQQQEIKKGEIINVQEKPQSDRERTMEESIEVGNTSGERRDSQNNFPVNDDNGERKSKRFGFREFEQRCSFSNQQHTVDIDITEHGLAFGGKMIPNTNGSSHHIVHYSSTKPSNTESVSETNATPTTSCTINCCKPELVLHNNSPSPTRIRERQRKMEMTLQHIQNNSDDRTMSSTPSPLSISSKKHHNLESHYPISTPYVPKQSDVCGDSSCKSRHRSTHHRSTVPPLKELDELEILTEVPQEGDSSIVEESAVDHTKNFRISILHGCDDFTSSKWILESMREEIRLENERMEDATKSLMMEDDFSSVGEKKRKEGNGSEKIQEKNTGESRQSFKGFGYGNSSNSNPPITSNTFHHNLEQLNNTQTPVLGAEALESKDGISNLNGPTQTQQMVSNIKAIFIPSEINSTGAALDGLGSTDVAGERSFSSNGANVPFGGSTGAFCSTNRPMLGERAHSYSGQLPLGATQPQFRNTRSFSLRDNGGGCEGTGSDVGSPDGGLPSGLQRAISCDSVSSDTSVGVGDLDPPHPTGYLCISLEYDCETADLLVNVMEAKELVGPDPNSMLAFDSYVRVYLLPDKTTNMQTRVYRKSLNPVYREKFMFGVETIELPLRTLVFYLYATDKYSNTLVGETEVKLGDLDIYQPLTTWLQLTDTGQRGGESGEIMFSLSYLPTAERLTVVVVKARNLKFPHERETGDPFVKVYLLQKGKKVSKKKSSTKRGEKNPIFNEAMIFSVPAHALQTIQLRITVADTSEIEGRANSIGHVIVGSSTAGKPLSHWNQMLSSLRKPIAMWHPLFK